MEGIAAEIADGAERTAFVGRADTLSRVLDHDEAVLFGDGHDRIHFAGDAGVVDNRDHAGFVGDGGFDLIFIDIHGVRAHVHKHELCASRDKGVRRRTECEGGQDHLIARFYMR